MRKAFIILIMFSCSCDKLAPERSKVRSVATIQEPSLPTKVSLFEARRNFKTVIKSSGERWGAPDIPPQNNQFTLIRYKSPVGLLHSYLTKDPGTGKKYPAIIWITGGDSNTVGEVWAPRPRSNDQSASGFRKSEVVMMFPSLRGGNDNPGKREGFYGELDDILAARDFLATRSYVDPDKIYLGGHSTGGTMVLLAGAYSNKFRAVFSLGPVAHIESYGGDVVYSDPANEKENKLRSPVEWLDSIQTPMYVFEGEGGNVDSLRIMEKENENPKVHFFVIPDHNHFSVIAPLTDFLGKQVNKDVLEITPETLKNLK